MVQKQPKGQTRQQILIPTAKGVADSRRRAQAELAERLASGIILNPDEVAGLYDAGRLLITTLGGVARPITQDDLAQFRDTARKLGQKFRGGITAKQIIDLSLRDRRERAHAEIKTAVPVQNSGGRVQFQTGVGPNSKHNRHYVTVDFMMYNAVVASPAPAAKLVGELIKGPVRIDCSCEDNRFMFRYIHTVGKFNAGRAETGFPKIKNAALKGVACKHVLRVMALVTQSPTFKEWATRMINRGREKLTTDADNQKIAEAREFAEKAAKESHRQRRIMTTEEKRAERARWNQKKALTTAVSKAKAPKKAAAAGKKAKIATDKAAATLAAQFGMTAEQVLALLAAQQKG